MNSNFKAVYLKPNKERAIHHRHPWVFSGAIAKIDDSIDLGDAVCLMDHQKKPLALGYWCGGAGIVIRLVSFEPDYALDPAFFRKRFIGARDLRRALGLPNQRTNGFRLIHGEGDGLSGLVCDVFNDTASIQLSNPGLKPIIDDLCQFLVDIYNIKSIYFDDGSSGQWILPGQSEVLFKENGHMFFATVGHGQKTGYFLDQRANRDLVEAYAREKNVLDTFCYSGGFTVHALQGGARSVTSVDISHNALLFCEKNVASNDATGAHALVEADCFTYLRELQKDDFELIILDPPAFAKTAHAVAKASRGYKDINLLAMKAIRSGGYIFTFSCSQHVAMDLFKKIIFSAAVDSQREVKIVAELTQGGDHPVSVYCPQSLYLKGLMLYVE
ncbi:MAG TPA: class I SAM-dependent rRNA methyltransferase [Myxococcota bacterium]|nr:class I SAM-dependent rRNA methyltransferase [Myxococcota bacterium]